MPRNVDELVGCCPDCGVRYHGREHVCRIQADTNNYHPMGAQFLDEFDSAKPSRRRYGQRLDEGFEMLLDSGWDGGWDNDNREIDTRME